jgi:hypothetical protein
MPSLAGKQSNNTALAVLNKAERLSGRQQTPECWAIRAVAQPHKPAKSEFHNRFDSLAFVRSSIIKNS